jgi:hypothetical protein
MYLPSFDGLEEGPFKQRGHASHHQFSACREKELLFGCHDYLGKKVIQFVPVSIEDFLK